MKKIITIFLSIVLLLNLVAFQVYADISRDVATKEQLALKLNSEQRSAIELLTVLGVFDKALNEEELIKPVSREEFAKYLAKLLNCGYNNITTNCYFEDAKSNNAVNDLTAMGIFKGNSDRLFLPNNPITLQEVCIALVRATGYESYAAATGNSIYSYLITAKQSKLIKDVQMGGDASFLNVIMLLYNALQVNMYEAVSVSGEIVQYREVEGKTILSKYHDVYKAKGVVTANRFTSLHYLDTDVKNKGLKIDKVIYDCSDKEAYRYIGQNVIAFYHQSNLQDTGEIICLIGDEGKNETIEIAAQDVVSYSENILEYYSVDTGKLNKLSLPNSLAVIWNGKAAIDGFESLFDFKIGTVRLYQNQSSNVYDVAVIESIENVVVKSTDWSTESIYTDDHTGDLEFLSVGAYTTGYVAIYSATSNITMNASDLLVDSLLSVIRSQDGEYLEIYLCSQKVAGTIEEVKNDGQVTDVTISGTDYRLSPEFELDSGVGVGSSVTFYLDITGKIAKCASVQKSDNTVVAYLYKLHQKSGLTEEASIKVYTEKSEHLTLTFAKKVKFNGDILSATNAASKLVSVRTGELTPQLICYQLDSNGSIKYIDTAATSKSVMESGGAILQMASLGSYFFFTDDHMFTPLYPLLPGKTKVIIIPPTSEESPKEKQFAVMDYQDSEPFVYDTYYTVGLYKTDLATPYVDYVIYQMSESSYYGFPAVVLVDRVSTILDGDGCNILKVNGYSNYFPVTLYTDADCKVWAANASNFIAETSASAIKSGGIIRYDTNAVGDISKIQIVYDFENNRKYWGQGYSGTSPIQMCKGEVSKVYRNNLGGSQSLISMNYNNELVEYIVFDETKTKFMIYDKDGLNRHIYVGTINDIVDATSGKGDELVIKKTGVYFNSFILYK